MNDKQKNFLEYWKKGVHLAGEQFFNIKSDDIDSANDKEQLVPNFNFIKDIFGSLSHGEKIMLGLLYSFYVSFSTLMGPLRQQLKGPPH